MVGAAGARRQLGRSRYIMLRKGDCVDNHTRLFEPELTGMTIRTELAEIAGMVAGEVGAVVAAIRLRACGSRELFVCVVMPSRGQQRGEHEGQGEPPPEITQDRSGLHGEDVL